MMMMGSHDDHGDHQPTTITKEALNGDNTLSVTIPPMTVGKEGTISITLRSKSSIPESVGVHYMISKTAAGSSISSHNHEGGSTSNDELKTIHNSIVMKQGASIVLFTPSFSGSFVFTIEIEKTVGVDSTFSLETNFMVHEKKNSGMMGMGGMWDYPVLGILVMGTMMVGVWMIRGGIF